MSQLNEQALRELEAFHLNMMPAIQAPSTAILSYDYPYYAERLKKYLVRFADLEFSQEKINQIPSGHIESRELHAGRGQRTEEFKKLAQIIRELQAYIIEKGVIEGAFIDPISGVEPNSIDGYKIMLKYEQENRITLLAAVKEAKEKLYSKENEFERLKKDFDSWKNSIGFTHKSHEQVDEMVKEVERKNADELTAAKDELDVIKAEFSSFKDVIQKKKLTASSEEFRKQADSSRAAANKWMAGIFISLAVFITILFIIATSNNKELFEIAADISEKAKGISAILAEKLTMIEVIKKITAKIVLFSMGIYLISFLVKNYNAQMHNHIVNAQKANALRSTVELIGTAKEDEGNDKIILQATQAIFTTQKSGYQGADSEPTSPSVITNVIEAVSGGKKSS
jgi:hypothetical protein